MNKMERIKAKLVKASILDRQLYVAKTSSTGGHTGLVITTGAYINYNDYKKGEHDICLFVFTIKKWKRLVQKYCIDSEGLYQTEEFPIERWIIGFFNNDGEYPVKISAHEAMKIIETYKNYMRK